MSRILSATLKVAIHTTALDVIDAAGATAYVNIRDSDDVLLSTLPLDYPAGSVNGTTGQLTLTPGARDEEAAATGTASYAELCDHADVVHITLTCAEGSTPMADTCVLSSLSIVAGYPVELLSFTIG